jgi:hypothetical protein
MLSGMTVTEVEVSSIKPHVPDKVRCGTKKDLVVIHEEMQRLYRIAVATKRSVDILSSIRQGMEQVLGLESHRWDMESPYDPDNPPPAKGGGKRNCLVELLEGVEGNCG